MTTWVLIIFFAAGGNNGVALDHIAFSTLDKCRVAKKLLTQMKPYSSVYYPPVRAHCVETGIPPISKLIK